MIPGSIPTCLPLGILEQVSVSLSLNCDVWLPVVFWLWLVPDWRRDSDTVSLVGSHSLRPAQDSVYPELPRGSEWGRYPSGMTSFKYDHHNHLQIWSLTHSNPSAKSCAVQCPHHTLAHTLLSTCTVISCIFSLCFVVSWAWRRGCWPWLRARRPWRCGGPGDEGGGVLSTSPHPH